MAVSQTDSLAWRNGNLVELRTTQQDTEIVRLKLEGLSFAAIGKQLGLSTTSVHRGFHRQLKRIPAAEVAAYRDEQLARIQMLREVALDVIAKPHYVVSNGHVVHIEVTNGEGYKVSVPLIDDMPVLQAMDRIDKLDDREAKLLGMYPDARTRVDGNVHFTLGAGIDDSQMM